MVADNDCDDKDDDDNGELNDYLCSEDVTTIENEIPRFGEEYVIGKSIAKFTSIRY